MTPTIEETEKLCLELGALLEKATLGPWLTTERSGYHEILAPDDGCDWYGRENMHAVLYCDTEIEEGEQEANAALVVAAKNALPTLLATIRDLSAKLAEVEGERDAWKRSSYGWQGTACNTLTGLNAAEEKIRRYREALQSADAFALGPNGEGGMKITLNFADVQIAGRAFAELSDDFNARAALNEESGK